MSPEYTKLEAETRKEIDAKLEAAGWVIQDKNRLNLFCGLKGNVPFNRRRQHSHHLGSKRNAQREAVI